MALESMADHQVAPEPATAPMSQAGS
jgi:hypothetical protein